MICELIYGGKVTDEYDRKILEAIVDKYCNSNLLNEDYKFSSDSKI